MSDFYRNQPDPNNLYGDPAKSDGDAWEPPFFSKPENPRAENETAPEDLYASWRRPSGEGARSSFLDDEPTPFGAELQQGGVPLFDPLKEPAQEQPLFSDDAPTRIAKPVQMVKKRTTIGENPVAARPMAARPAPTATASVAPAAPTAPVAQPDAQPRRRSRMERRHQEEEAPVAPVVSAAPAFDPFSAGDSEMPEEPRADAAEEKRAALPGGRYTGPRTAMPAQSPAEPLAQRTAPAARRSKPLEAGDEPPRRPAQPGALAGQPPRRPAQPGASAGQPPRRPVQPDVSAGQPPRRPVQQGAPTGQPPRRPAQPGAPVPQPPRRPAQPGAPVRRPPVEEEAPRKQLPEEQSPYAYRAKQRPSYEDSGSNPRASVPRKPYDFEKDEEEPAPRRRGHALVSLLIVLLILGGLLAALCIPNWEAMGGTVGNLVSPWKAKVVSAFASVKGMILPQEDPIKDFNVSASGSVAPATLRFTVQTSKSIAGIRVEDDNGATLYNKPYDSQLIASGDALENSNALIWTPSCMLNEEYAGGFTVYAQLKDGKESEGVRATTSVSVSAPKPALPPVQSFSADAQSDAVPTAITFTLLTSADVTAVQVVDQYNSPVAAASLDEGADVTENGDARTWTLTAQIVAPYAGNYAAQYMTDLDVEYVPSGYSVNKTFTASSAPEDAAAVSAPTEAPASTSAPTQAPTNTPVPTPSPTPTVAPTPTPAPTLAPDSTPLPDLTAAAAEGTAPGAEGMKLNSTIYENGKVKEAYTRANPISLLNAFTTYAGGSDYAIWKQAGVLTFRSGPLRQNAAYGVVDVSQKKLTTLWSQPIGSMKVNKDTLYGVNAPGQPVIIKWPTEVRQRMGINDEMKNVTALKEVIMAGQDGKIYFYNLLDGAATREPYNLGAPSAGGLSVATNGTPILGVGQSHSRLATKTVSSGYHVINLLKNQEELLLATDGKDRNSNYSGVLGAALFDAKTGTMIVGSQGGVLYTAELGKQDDAYLYEAGTISLSKNYQGYKAMARGQDEKNTNIDSSAAMYGSYVYYGDRGGIVQCVDVNTLTPVWAVNTGDSVDSTPALDVEGEDTVALYTGNMILNQRKSGVCTIRRLDALTGETVWSYEAPGVTYSSEYDVGAKASPVVGQKSLSDLVIYTVTNGKLGSHTIALNKQTGAVQWKTDFSVETVSSPVAVYNESGDAWIIQALSDGQINLLDGKTGEVLDTLKLDAQIKASPAVYGNLLVIGTTGKDTGATYCIKID